MKIPFPQWARQEIARLRAEATGLEREAMGLDRALNQYLAANEEAEDASSPAPAATLPAPRPIRHRGRKASPETAKLVNLVKNSDEKGVSYEEAYQFADTDLKIDHKAVRAVFQSNIRREKFKKVGDRFFFAAAGLNGSHPSNPATA